MLYRSVKESNIRVLHHSSHKVLYLNLHAHALRQEEKHTSEGSIYTEKNMSRGTNADARDRGLCLSMSKSNLRVLYPL